MFHVKHHTVTITNVPRETFIATDKLYDSNRNTLETYLDRLLWWNKRVNLVSRNVPRETIKNHVLHSLLASQLEKVKQAEFIVDAGTGGGLPGIPLAITHPDKSILLNDIVSKKCLAMKQMTRRLHLKNATVADKSIEDLRSEQPVLLISKHAFKINKLIEMTTSLPWQAIVLYKGIEFKEELEGIETPLQINALDLSGGSEIYTDASEFYSDKALLIIQKQR